jgi:glyoxalase family protein
MTTPIRGIHHITAVSGPPKENYDFYTKVLGLRFTKKTINFDDPFTYHLYYGNYEATPGSSITFFPWQGVVQGSPNSGETTVTAYAIPHESVDFWKDHLQKSEVEILSDEYRFGVSRLLFKDVEGMKNELVESDLIASIQPNPAHGIPEESAIRGFYGATLSLTDTGRTAELMKEFGWEKIGEENETIRFSIQTDNNLGGNIDLKKEPGLNGRFGRGFIHHIAFRVPDDETQLAWRDKLLAMGFSPTPVQNRMYFRSIYFREPGGVLFEIATDIPGFTKDETLENLGSELRLPPWHEQYRKEIEQRLPEL